MITVKSADGLGTENVASNGKTNTALGLAIGALGTSLLSGGFNGLLGGGLNTGVGVGVGGECAVSKDQFYQTLIAQINEQSARDIAVERRFAGIEANVAVNSTANAYQNRAVDTRFESENIINNLNRQLAICQATKNVVYGQTYLSPTALADSFISPTRVIDSHEAREYLPGRSNFGYGGGCGCGGAF